METNDLLQQCQAGDEAAIEMLVNQYQREVTLLALSILDDADMPPGELSAEAEEAAQDAFLAALRALPGYRGEASFKTWLFSITINVCRNRQRKRRAMRRLKRTLEGWLHFVQTEPPEERVIGRERDSALWRAVGELGEKHRLPVILRYYHDLPVAEIAALLNTSEGTVHSRLFTARERLRRSLEESGAVDRAGAVERAGAVDRAGAVERADPPGKADGPGARNQPLFSTAAVEVDAAMINQAEALAPQAEDPNSALLKRRR